MEGGVDLEIAMFSVRLEAISCFVACEPKPGRCG